MLAAGTGGLDKRGTVLAGEENFEELIPRVLLIIVNAVCTCQEEFGKGSCQDTVDFFEPHIKNLQLDNVLFI